MDDHTWSTIIRLQQELKRLVILAEENELNFNVFLQPTMEQRSALDHICRAMAFEVGITKNVPNSDYAQKQYDKAIGHLYRAFFDVADWMEIILREKILNLVKPYDAEVIRDVIPEYYSDIRPRLETFARNISTIRAGKDIGQSANNVIALVDEYSAKIDELLVVCEKLMPIIPALNDRQKKQNKAKSHSAFWAIVLVLISVILTAIATYWFTPKDQSSTQTQPSVIQQSTPKPTK